MSERSAAAALRWRLVCLLAALGFAASYLVVGSARVLYPYDLEMTEDDMLMQALRTAQGLPVFVPANADFVPQVYMPLYTWLGGQLLKLTSTPPYIPLRLLSFLATLGTAGLLFLVARRESRSPALGLVCAALFLAGYRLTGGFYELARVDALFVALAMAAATLTAYGGDTRRGVLGAGALCALAFLTKQHGLLFGLVGGYLLWRRGRARVWLFAGAFLLVAAVPLALLIETSRGAFTTYAFGIAYANPIDLRRVAVTVLGHFGGAMPVLSLAFALAVASRLRQQGVGAVLADPWILFTATAIAVSVAGRASVGGHLNNLIPAYAFLCLSPALASGAPPASARRMLALYPALLLQLLLTLRNPLHLVAADLRDATFLPTAAMRASGDRFIQRVKSIEGPVFVMMHPYYALLAGKEPSVQVHALWHARWRGREPLPVDLVQRIESGHYAAIVSDHSRYFEDEAELVRLIDRHYETADTLGPGESAPTISGMAVRPRTVYRPRR